MVNRVLHTLRHYGKPLLLVGAPTAGVLSGYAVQHATNQPPVRQQTRDLGNRQRVGAVTMVGTALAALHAMTRRGYDYSRTLKGAAAVFLGLSATAGFVWGQNFRMSQQIPPKRQLPAPRPGTTVTGSPSPLRVSPS